MEQIKEISLIMVKMIRDRSEMDQLAQFEALLTQLTEKGLVNSETAYQRAELEDAFRQALSENEDIRPLSGRNGILQYYSSLSLSETYAGILVRKEESSLIAEIVRENSAIYPRPIPLGIFTEPPFDLTQEEIVEYLKEMGKQGDYQDIAQTITSIGTTFLYSNQHLDPPYASALAEWIDVGETNNP